MAIKLKSKTYTQVAGSNCHECDFFDSKCKNPKAKCVVGSSKEVKYFIFKLQT